MNRSKSEREKLMMRCKYLVRLAVLGVLATAICGCAGRGYQLQTGERTYYPALGAEVPPSFYGNDPALEQWYTPPYWNPGVDH